MRVQSDVESEGGEGSDVESENRGSNFRQSRGMSRMERQMCRSEQPRWQSN